MGLESELAQLVRAFDPQVIARGRKYAVDGRVTGIRREDARVKAFVHGSTRYEVSVALEAGAIDADCTCPAYEREGQCKHLAAVSVALTRPQRAEETPREDLPEVLQSVYSSAAFFARLPLYVGGPLAITLEQWLPLYEWWRRPGGELLRKTILEIAPRIEKELSELKSWQPPETPLPGTVYGDLYESLADTYRSWAERAKVRRCAPGPLDRHPGFSYSWDAKRRLFEARERSHPLLAEPHRFGFQLPHAGRGQPRLEDSRGYGDPDAWELFALRAILIDLVLREENAFEEMADQLGRPVWDALLEKLVPKAESAAVREWAFAISERYGRDLYVKVFSRTREKWKGDKLDALYADDNASIDEKDIARIALCSSDRGGEARIALGTPQAHELLKALAKHERVFFSTSGKLDSVSDPKAEIVVGPMTMRLEAGANGALSPRFLVGEKDLSGVVLDGSGSLRGGARGAMLASTIVPPALKPWLEAAQAGTVAFPPEAIPRLLEATQPLVASGHIRFPRNALGAEVEASYAAGLRVEWRPEGGAVVTVFAQVHPKAPLVTPGAGPELFTFEVDGQRVFAERDLEEEKRVANKVRSHVPVVWDQATGRADGIAEAVQLAEWLDRNPLGIQIEVTIGKTPTVMGWDQVSTGNISVRREGSWLVLDGALDVKGAKLTLGDVLDAARMARRFVKARDGLFLELSREAIERLKPLAIAAELAPEGKLHPAFGPLIGDALDDREIRQRFERRVEKVRVPSIEGTLRPYQKEGVAWILRLASWAPGCVLADDMGLGKTVQTAAVLKARAASGPQLIVAPASVTSNWMSELARFVPKLNARWFNEERDLAKLEAEDVVVVSYGLLGKLPETHWSTVVIDEAQYVKNAGAMRTDAVRNLDRDFTIALTGTPLENHAGELFSIVDLVFPGLLGTEGTFRDRFRKPIEGARDASRLAILGRLLTPFLLRRTRKDVLDELPPREEITEWIDLSPGEQKRYLALRKACEQQFAKRKKGETAAQMRIALLAALTRLRQLACDPWLVDSTWTEESTKITRAVEIATELAQEKNRALVFSQFTTFLTKLKKAFEKAGLRVAYLSGETPTAKRKQIVDAFQNGDYDVFCVSLLAGGTGLNLTSASYVIHTDPWWNPAAEEQATSRAHRMGQTEPVTVYRMVSRGTIEEAVLEMHGKKKELAAAVLEGKSEATSISSDDLLALLQR